MLRFILLSLASLFFISCSQDRIVLQTIGEKPPKELNIKTISKVTIPVQEDGYNNFSTMLITSQKQFNTFVSEIKSQKGWSKKDNFLASLEAQKTDFSKQNLLLYRISKASNSDVLLVHKPKGNKKNITIKIGEESEKTENADIAYYALAYKVSKSVSKITFKSGVQKEVIKNSASESESKIPESCLEWFDGCNSCSRTGTESSPTCTEKACDTYKAFKCTKWKESPKQQKPVYEPSHHDIELDSLPRSPQLSNE